MSAIENTGNKIKSQLNIAKCQIENLTISNSEEQKLSLKQSTLLFRLSNTVKSFRGRDKELATINELFQKSKMVAVCGMAGIGKTELARNYAHTNRERFQHHIAWIDSESSENLKQSFFRLATELNLYNSPTRDTCSVVRDVYCQFRETSVLFIFDNIENRKSLNPFLPPSDIADSEIYILLTTQNKSWSEDIATFSLTRVTEQAALDVFSSVLGDKFNHERDGQVWLELARALSCIPLALQIAAAYVKQESDGLNKHFDLARYSETIKQGNELLDKPFPSDSEHDYRNTVYTSIKLTLESIEKNENDLEVILKVLYVSAYLDPENIYDYKLLELFAGSDANDKLTYVYRILTKYSLISVEYESNNSRKVFIHRLVQKVLRYHQTQYCIDKKYYRITLNATILGHNASHIRSVLQFHQEYSDILYDVYKRNKNNRHILYNFTLNECNTVLDKIFKSMFACQAKRLVKRFGLLHLAVETGNLETVKIMFKYYKNVNALGSHGTTPLNPACYFGYIEIVKFLLANGASPSIKCDGSLYPVHYAFIWGHKEIVKILIDATVRYPGSPYSRYTPIDSNW